MRSAEFVREQEPSPRERFERTPPATGKLVIFDIDDTLVNTDTKINVVRDGKIVKQLNSHDFTHYHLQPGEEFDFGAFRDAREFYTQARPIPGMMRQLQRDIETGNKVIMLTARSDFNDRDVFLDTFRQYGIDMDRVHVYRAGNLAIRAATEEKKKIILKHLLGKHPYEQVIMYDDSVPNLNAFLSLSQDYPWSRFYAWHVDPAGQASEYHRTNVRVTEINAPGELSVDHDLIRRFTDRGWEIDGEGRDQIVMSRPGTNRVLKIVGQGTNTHTGEIRRAVQFFRDHQRNPHFPRVGQDRTFNWKGKQYYVYTQERLAPLSGDEEILDYLEYVMGEIGHGEDPDYGRTPPGLSVEQIDGLVSAIYDMFDEGMLTQTNFDLGNVANIMQRANGQLVIVDPASHMQDVTENSADGHTPADAVLDYVKRKHHDFRMDREILMYPRWQLTEIPLGNLIIADYTDSDIDLDQVDVVKRDPKRKIYQSPIVVDPAGAIIDGNHRAFAARELGMTHIPAWRPVDDLDENFADGRVKGKSRPGRVKRAGASCKGSVTDLRARAKKYGGERGKMYHWCANMKSGRKK